MKQLDFIIQSIILLFALAVLTISIGDSDWPIIILWVQLILGPWQMLSSLLSIILKAPYLKSRVQHFVISIVYLSVLIAGSHIEFFQHIPKVAVLISLTVPAWLLGLYYYYITWHWFFDTKKSTSRFLPHINF